MLVIFFVANSPGTVKSVQQNAVSSSESDTTTGPLDQLSSADIAVHVAFITGLPEANSVANHADSISATEASSPADNSVVAKPQVVAAALPSAKDIHTYIVQPGDDISTISAKFGVSSDSIRWSNGMTGNSVAVGKNLVLPPPGQNGIVYTVKSGDTADSLAQRYNADKDLLISFNDAEVGGLKIGQQILIPNGVLPSPVTSTSSSYSYYSSGFAWGGSAPIYGRNAYDYGWCTYYVASKVAVPSNWGNANTWDSGARASGWIVSPIPRAGAVAQTDRLSYLGHVAYIEEVNEDGTMIKYSDMNGLAGWGRVGYSGWVPASTFQNYIYR